MTPIERDSKGVESQLRGDIAIVGMGCLFAGAPDLDAFWNNILSKHDAVSDPPADEWDPKLFYDPASKSNDRVYCKRGGYIGDIAQFRPLDFGVMPITVDGGEPDQWLALRVAQEALTDAGYTEPPKEHVRTEVILGKGTYVNRGNLTVGYHGMVVEYFLQTLKNLHPEYTDAEIEEIKKELKAGLPPFSADTAPALIGNIIAGRIANRLDLMGPSFTVDAACASALLAIEIGIRDLLTGKCDLVLAGGANVNAPLPTLSLFCQLGALSKQERIRPFDKNADGTILGEGLGMIVMKRREDAERDQNRIYAIVKGVGLASDGRALHVMAPRIEGEELALRRAYEMAGVDPRTVGLIEAHGTATPVGDLTEVQALSRVFGKREAPLPSCSLGSVKSMIGHTMPAAGIAGVIKAALSLYHRVLPPTLNCDEPNPALQLDQTPFHVNTEVRPWIHGAETPRRAGVNSFGFGGINAHAVLEEYPEEAPNASSRQLHWETECCILEAESRAALFARAEQLRDYLAHADGISLKDLAYTLNTRLQGQPARLTLIATSLEDLSQKLTGALKRLADPKCRQIKDNAGVYFFDQPFEGKLAFLFPGEGAQYPNMLLDLCVHFPEVRRCFDLVERVLTNGYRKILPGDIIFPRTKLSASEQSEVDKALWQIDGAVEGVLIGNWAMWTLLNRLEIRPDLIVGHSTGDYSALLASKIINMSDEQYVDAILAWNQVHGRLADRVAVPDAMLVAVAAGSKVVMEIVNAVGGDLYLAMDNCPHQCVLVGSKAAAEQAIELLRNRGLIYEVLPFDRPYHTPMFRDYAEAAEAEFFANLPISGPRTETFSCTTAARYPAARDEIRQLYIDHWVGPVLFTDTVNKMYDEGVRIFVEAGPRGNLTAFVSDILRGKPHLAMQSNGARRSGLTQINHLVGVLAAQGVGMNVEYLYARRDPRLIPWEEGQSSSPKKARAVPMKLSLALPPLKVAPRKKKAAQTSSAGGDASLPRNGSLPEVPPASNPEPPNRGKTAPRPMASTPDSPRQMPQQAAAGVALAARAASNASSAVMQEYFKGMETFLEVESQVMSAFLARSRGDGGRPTVPVSSPEQFPLLGTVVSLVPGQELKAVRELSITEDLFLRDHALGGPVSLMDPELQPLVVVPLTMSMEILAEAGVALMPESVLVEMRDVQGHQWIRVDDAPVTLEITAQIVANSSREVQVRVRNISESADAKPVIQGVMVFSDEYPIAPRAGELALRAGRKSRLASVPLYDGRLMFHGPCFQGVSSIDRSGENGMIGQLEVLPTGGLFRSMPEPQFVIDPVVLDAAGQLVGFWAAEYLQRGFVVFPYYLKSLRIYGPNRTVGERLVCQVNLQLTGNDGIVSDIQVSDDAGTVWMELDCWTDRRFDPPQRFHNAWIAPQDSMVSDLWPIGVAGVPGNPSIECHRLDAMFPQGGGFWKDLWASLVLTRSERKAFAKRTGPDRKQLEWLSGRTVAKDAIRSFVRKRYGLELLPADIEITHDEYGKPFARGSWTSQLPAVPSLALSHSEGTAVALVGDGGSDVGIDIQAIRDLQPDFENIALSANERQLLNQVNASHRSEWLLRFWCAKEAISKALGRGLIEGPSSIRITAFDEASGFARGTPYGKLAADLPQWAGQEIAAYTGKDADYVFASTFQQSEAS